MIDLPLLGYVGAGVVIHAPDDRVLTANAHACRLLGMSLEQMVGKKPSELAWLLVREDETPMPLSEYPASRLLIDRQPIRDSVMGIDLPAIQERVWVLASALPEFTAQERLRYAVVTLVDITDLKRREGAYLAQLHLARFASKHTRDELLDEMLNEAERLTGSALGFWGVFNDDETFLTLQNWSPRTRAAFCQAEVEGLQRTIDRAGVWGECVRRGEAVIQNDSAAFPQPTGVPTGHVTVARQLAVPVFRDGKVAGILGVANKPGDYTEKDAETVSLLADLAWETADHQRAEEATAAERGRFYSLLEAMPAYLGLMTPKYEVAFANRSFRDRFGEVKGRRCFDYMFGRSEPCENCQAFVVLETGKPSEYEWVGPDGGIYQICDQLVHDTDGSPLVLEMGLDITVRKRAEQELRFRNLILSTQQEATIDGILVVDENALIVSCNRRFVEMWSIPHELIENRIDDPVLQHVTRQMADPPSFLRLVRHLYEHRQETGRGEFHLSDGRVVDWYSAPMFGSDGCYYGRVWHHRDITERVKAEADRADLQAQLLQAQKMESVGRLAGGVAHDFNNILAVQKGYGELMRSRVGDDAELAESLAQIEACTERAAALTSQLLAFSRKQTLQPRVLDLNALVEGLEDMLRRLVGEDVDLVVSSATVPALVKADPGQIEQVVMNLAVNARDAMPQGGTLAIGVSMVELDEAYCDSHLAVVAGPHVMLTVSDTGCGIDADTQGRIFEPFFTTKGEGKGTGLGLSTVHGIVRQSGGDVWVYSELGKGTTFKIHLPQAEREPEQAAKQAVEAAEARGELVLIVEDELSLRELAMLMVDRLGYQAVEAVNGAAALILVEEEGLRPDLVLTDVIMPGVGGPALVERLRKTAPSLKAVYMSGYTDEALAHHGILDPGINFLQKPFSMADLAATLSVALSGV